MKYVILGASAAGISAARELRRLNRDDTITLISKDEFPYSRCILHHYLSDERTKDGISFVEKDFEKLYNIQYIKGRTCLSIDDEKKAVHLDDGSAISFDKLLIATGASSFYPPIKGLAGTGNIQGFRNLEDVELLKEKAPLSRHIVIIGGGLVGVDALSGLLHRGNKPALIEMAGHLLSKQLDERAALPYQQAFTEMGARFYFSTGIQEIRRNQAGNIQEILLTDGRILPCDLLIVTAGVRANIEFLANSAITVSPQGLVINTAGRTSNKDIFGAGDVTGLSPIWPAAVKEGIIAARSMSGINNQLEDFFTSKSTMNFAKIPTMSLGVVDAPDDSYITEIIEGENSYRKIIHKAGRIEGAVFQGDLSYCGILTQLIANKIDISKVKKPLFDIDYSDFFHLDKNFEFYYEGDK